MAMLKDKVEERQEEDANSRQVTGKGAIHDLVACGLVDREEFGKMEDRFR